MVIVCHRPLLFDLGILKVNVLKRTTKGSCTSPNKRLVHNACAYAQKSVSGCPVQCTAASGGSATQLHVRSNESNKKLMSLNMIVNKSDEQFESVLLSSISAEASASNADVELDDFHL